MSSTSFYHSGLHPSVYVRGHGDDTTIRHKNRFRVVTGDGSTFYVFTDGDPDPLFDGSKRDALATYRKLSGKS